MKRDMDLIRSILLSIEANDKVDVDFGDEGRLAQHIILMNEDELVRGIIAQEVKRGKPRVVQTMSYVRLTSRGHDLLDAIRDDEVWKKTQQDVAKVGGGVTLAILTALATEYLKQKLGLTP